MGHRKPRGRKQMFKIGPKGVAIHDLALPDTQPEIEWFVAKGWAGVVESKDPGVFNVTSLEKLPESNHDFTIRTRTGDLKYLQLTEFIGDPKFYGDYESAAKEHNVGERFEQVMALINKKAMRYGDTKDVVLLIYITESRFNFAPIIPILGTRFNSDPPPFERLYEVSMMRDGSAAVGVIHPFRGTLLSEPEIQGYLGMTAQTLGPEDMIYKTGVRSPTLSGRSRPSGPDKKGRPRR